MTRPQNFQWYDRNVNKWSALIFNVSFQLKCCYSLANPIDISKVLKKVFKNIFKHLHLSQLIGAGHKMKSFLRNCDFLCDLIKLFICSMIYSYCCENRKKSKLVSRQFLLGYIQALMIFSPSQGHNIYFCKDKLY